MWALGADDRLILIGLVGDLNIQKEHFGTLAQDNKVIDSLYLYAREFIPLSVMVTMVKSGP